MTGMTSHRIARIAAASLAALALTTGAVALTGCGESDAQVTSGESSDPATYTQADTTIQAQVGETFVIQMASNPTTGYQWKMTPTGDPGVNLESSKYVPDTQTGTATMVGMGGMENWTFSAVSAGTGTLVFDSIPPGKTTPAETVTFNVTVAD
jgi:predicted secreted protein